MFSTKNVSPRQLAASTALALSVPVALGFYVFEHSWRISFILFLAVFLLSFGLIFFTLQHFIYRKIKLIYKLIYQTKASRREEFYYKNVLPQKSIDEVREDVEKWALQRNSEIDLLRQNEQFRKEFLQNLSHELKTPIFAIQGYVDTLLGGALTNPEVNTKFLQSAARNTDRLVNLVDDLDEITRLESGTAKLNMKRFAIHDVVKEVYESFGLQAAEKHISLNIKKGCNLSLQVFADKEKIRQVFTNLVSNAIKYGKNYGTIEASFYEVDENLALVEISDDGHGIADEHISRIFERFYRTDEARTRKVGGSGLGLSICKHIIEAHNQPIHVRSKLNVGTTFGFTLLRKEGR